VLKEELENLNTQLIAERLASQQTKDRTGKEHAENLMDQQVQFDTDKDTTQRELSDLRSKFYQLQLVKQGIELELNTVAVQLKRLTTEKELSVRAALQGVRDSEVTEKKLKEAQKQERKSRKHLVVCLDSLEVLRYKFTTTGRSTPEYDSSLSMMDIAQRICGEIALLQVPASFWLVRIAT
jgi:cell division protein FtsI/penicillin-binding protein 2